ncbi:unnamed protein product [Mytilus coruscus]|uniref:Uncharacterized protein n=1 Tax=Mytilus coruscus TaxID=42192 RepID=A0A6J8DNQ6_MYTCO|nr:unnamed protein product [Mytilus coruscus]
MLLGNVTPKYRSQLYVIQLAILCMSSLIKTEGFSAVIDPLLQDLKLLEEEGITIMKSDGEHRLYGTVTAVIADNLGAHAIGGFLESFNCLRNCRHCFVTKQDMQTMFSCNDFTLRSIAMHQAQLANVAQDSTMSSVYGIKNDSPLNSLKYFHVAEGMPSDLAHDLFEGVVCEVMTNTIGYCVREKFFTLEELNNIITKFEFCTIDKANKPTTVSNQLRNLKVKQTAAQIWCFTRFLPLMVGDKIPYNNPKWKTFLSLRDLLFYVCAPVLDRGHIMVMQDIIEEFHEYYRENFPEETVKPKFHYTLHYPKQTLEFGPLIHLQTIRFEGKHSYFKELVYRTKNKKNICKSLAERHQYYQCIFNVASNFFDSGQIETTDGSLLTMCLLRTEFRQALQVHVGDALDVFGSKSIDFMGITYRNGECIVSAQQDGHFIQFSNVKHCLVIAGAPYLLCTKMSTIDFDRHFYAIIVEDSTKCEIIKISDLIEPHPFGVYSHPTINNSSVVIMKHMVHVP